MTTQEDLEAERRAFRRRLGLALSRTRTRLTGYSQETIAEELSVNTTTVGRWERGEREPKVFELHALATRYGVTGDLFLNPPDSLTELDRRIEAQRAEQLAIAAIAAAQVDVEEELRQQGVGAAAAPRGKPRARTQLRSTRSEPDR